MFARINYDGNFIEGSVENNLFISNDKQITLPIEKVKIKAPCNPTKIILAGLNYKSHAKELGMALPKKPIIFLKPPSSIIAHEDNILLPQQSNRVDYEAEIAVVISQKAKNVSEQNANKYILGITCLNDVTARDLQKEDGQWTRAKSFDTFCPVGPFIAKVDISKEFIIRAILNDKIVQEASSKDMIFSISQIISYVSSIMTLFPGDIIATGTPPGIGKLDHGDKICIEIEGIMKLCNFVV